MEGKGGPEVKLLSDDLCSALGLPSWLKVLQTNPWNISFCNDVCMIITTISSLEGFLLQCCCQWCVPACKRTC